jgi:murein L,D-transpeptidase YafK
MKLYEEGKFVKEYRIALGQSPEGHKIKQGDNKTPEGQYRIIEKTVGPFGGAYGSFLGSRWMRLNYPNTWDAEVGLRKNAISKSQFEQIEKANNEGREPLKTTKLGGGIGIHGWSGNWPETDRQNLTWGCVSMEQEALEDLYRKVSKGCAVLIYP